MAFAKVGEGDALDDLRIERNEMLKRKMAEGKNNLIIEKYITLSIKAQDIAQARIVFGRYDTEIATNIKKIGGAGIRLLSAAERLEILHDIYNPDSVGLFGNNMVKNTDLTHRNQKLFFMTFVIVHFADSLETLKSDSETIRSIGRRFVCDIKTLQFQMENGLTTALPLGNNQLKIKRSLTTESAAIFMPFVNQELMDRDGGMYYGNNAVSGNLILFNRRNCKNGNGFIFGVPGSGKSFSAKQEMQTVLLTSDDDVIVIDPEGEYYAMADLLDGEVIRIAAGESEQIFLYGNFNKSSLSILREAVTCDIM